jgi:hypothetical protein
MTTQFYKRPSAAYAGEAGLPNRTKYNNDSTASPRVPISSTKLDGDINYLIDAVNTLYDTAIVSVIPDKSITNAKLRDSVGLSVIGRSANTTGSPADIAAATDAHVLRRSGTTIGFGTVATAGIADGAVTAIKLASGLALPTGVIMPLLGTLAPAGWILSSGLTIGSSLSAATGRANADTQTLFELLWNNFADTILPVSSGRGASAAADFTANKTIQLPDLRGRTIFGLDNMGGTPANRVTSGVSGITGTTLGAAGGSEAMHQHTHTATVTDPGHAHATIWANTGVVVNPGGNPAAYSGGTQATASATTGISVSNANTGTGTSQNMPPAFVASWIIKL